MENELHKLIHEANIKLDARAFKDAESILKKALKIQKGNAAALMGLAMVYNRTARPKKAKELLNSLVLLFKPDKKQRGKKLIPKKKLSNPVMATLYAQLGVANQLLEEKDVALKMYKKALKLFPSKEIEYIIDSIENPSKKISVQKVLIRETEALLKINKIDEAQFILTKGLAKFPTDAKLLYLMSLSFRKQKNFEKALPFLQQAIIIDPEQALYYNDLGVVFQERENYTKAISFYKRAISKDSKYAIAYSNMGVAYKKIEMIPEAIEAYKKALIINENLAPVHNNLGNLLHLLGKKKKAIKHLKKALEIIPDYADAKQNLATILEENNE